MTSILDNIQTAPTVKVNATQAVSAEAVNTGAKQAQNGSSFSAIIERAGAEKNNPDKPINTIKSVINDDIVNEEMVSENLQGIIHTADPITQNSTQAVSLDDLPKISKKNNAENISIVDLISTEKEHLEKLSLEIEVNASKVEVAIDQLLIDGKPLPLEGHTQPIDQKSQPQLAIIRAAAEVSAKLPGSQQNLNGQNIVPKNSENLDIVSPETVIDKSLLRMHPVESSTALKIENVENRLAQNNHSATSIDLKDIQIDTAKIFRDNFLSKPTLPVNIVNADVATQAPQPIFSTIQSGLHNNTSSSTVEAKIPTMTMQTGYRPGSTEWSDSFSRNIALMAVSKNNLAEIRLDPPELGSILVKINHSSNETNLQFQIQHGDTRSAIESSIQRLKETLAEQGFVNVNVDIQHGEQSQNPQNEPSQSGHATTTNEVNGLEVEETVKLTAIQGLSSTAVDFFA